MGFLAAFTLGFFGSLHCVGMCAPIALALPYPSDNPLNKFKGMLLYNFGRILTYAALGLFLGLLGKSFFVAGLQQALSIGIGLTLIIIALSSIKVDLYLLSHPWVSKNYLLLKKLLKKQLQQSSLRSLFFIGILNGFLPCGLVYLGLVGALASGNPVQGMLFMVIFGLGTWPLMLLAGWSGKYMGIGLRKWYNRLYPLLLFSYAVLFLLRGWQFDLPSGIELWETMNNHIMCF